MVERRVAQRTVRRPAFSIYVARLVERSADIELKCIADRCRRAVLGDTWRGIACENLLIRAGWQEFANWSVAACLPGGIRSRGRGEGGFAAGLGSFGSGVKVSSYYCCAASGVTYCASGSSGVIAIECGI